MKLKLKRVRTNAILPKHQTKGAAGFDLHAAIDEKYILKSGERCSISTGIAIELPENYVLLIFARSGLAYKHGITLTNCVGVIDSDYRDEMSVLLINNGKEDFVIEPEMRIAQGVIIKHEIAEWEEVDELNETARGKGGFGSTGTK